MLQLNCIKKRDLNHIKFYTEKELPDFGKRGIRMCHSITIDKDRKLAQINARGRVNVLELKEIFMNTVGHEDWQSGFNMLCDYSEIEDFDVSSQDVNDITEWQISIDALIGNGRCAVVASKDSVYGMSRMWEILSSERSQQICVFRKIDDAFSWLGYAILTQSV